MQLLISVKNSEEALLALHAGADVIDLKDPNEGALGALSVEATAQILQMVNGHVTVSATVGEHHATQLALFDEIETRAAMGVDIVKIAVDKLFYEADFFENILGYTARVKLVALFFAEAPLDTCLLIKLQRAGFYGAMLDTQEKHLSLPEILPNDFLKTFIDSCKKNQLFCGLAGSLKAQHVEFLHDLHPTFIGFRGGVCENFMRKSALHPDKVREIKKMLLKHNKINGLAQKSINLTLHGAPNMGIVAE